MKYRQIDEDQKKHLLKLVDFLYYEVLSAGGDGDALWYSKHYDVADLLPLITEYNDKLKFKWEIEYNKEGGFISWGEGQAGMVITNDKEDYDLAPSWQQCIVVT